MTSVGTLAFAALPASRQWRAEKKLEQRRIGALASPGLRTLLAVSGAFGLAFGTLEVTMPAFADEHGSAAAAGVLLSGAALGSMAGGLWYGARTWAADQSTLLVRFSILFALALLPLALADSMAAMFVLLLLAGTFIAPWAATSYVLVGRLRAGRHGDRGLHVGDDRGRRGVRPGRRALSGCWSKSAGVAEALLVTTATGGRARARWPGSAVRRYDRPLDMSKLIHTCYRITDIDRSVAFYKALGFEETGRIPIRDEATNVFMNLPATATCRGSSSPTTSASTRTRSAPATATSRSPPTTSTERWPNSRKQGIEPEKPPYTVREGGSRLCFVRDPDGYRIELLEKPTPDQTR